ncbi:hypothetical protein D3C74_268430 [compost metagenome]
MGSLGTFLKQKRIDAGFRTQEHLAAFTFLAQGHISRAESSKTKPNEDTLMILAAALNLNYLEVFSMAYPQTYRTEEEIQKLNEQDQVDKALLNMLEFIFKKIFMNKDKEFEAQFLDVLYNELGFDFPTGVKTRIENQHNKINGDIIFGVEMTESSYNDHARQESVRLFYSLVRDRHTLIRGALLQKLQEFYQGRLTEKAVKPTIELTDDSYQFSIHGKPLSKKQWQSLIEHHLTAQRIEEMFKGNPE